METIIENAYSGIFDRVKAVIVDSIIIIIFMIIITDVFSSFEDVPNNARIIAFVFIFCLYDPLCTSIFGGTIGHMVNGIKVKRENNPEKNISFLPALFRYLVKSFLGWISLFTVMGNQKRQAIHDFLAGSVVVYRE
ncbi:RDD family protein [Aquimarina sp. MMG016]|uniref:RDD family protein n=1 Tax=Aquimarina sp. MMG016 TaxID=2822690 RepID=UPI001FFD65F3|nr:RDD family protein [Aquimarina sp. MMG016]